MIITVIANRVAFVKDAQEEERMDLDMIETLIENVKADEIKGTSLALTSYYENRLGIRAQQDTTKRTFD